jgi:hypothetical protein
MGDRRKTVPALVVVLLAACGVMVTLGDTNPPLALALILLLEALAAVLFSYVDMPTVRRK